MTIKINIEGVSFAYKDRMILKDISIQFSEHSISAIIGSSGVGKSTFLMILNRLWEDIPKATMNGTVEINLHGKFCNIYDHTFSLSQLRRMVSIVFQIPNPLPMSIYKNIAFPLKLAGEKNKEYIHHKVEEALKNSYLWKEVKDRLHESALLLSGGQQQRLCIARALVMEPQIMLLDEPTSSLDPKAAGIIEELLVGLKEQCTLIIVTHYFDQIRRIADTVMELSNGNLISKSLENR